MAQTSIGFRPRSTLTPGGATETAEAGTSMTLEVGGMDCASCAHHVTQALIGVPGVAAAQVDLAAGKATVRWKSGAIPDAQPLVSAVTGAGYEAHWPTPAATSTGEFRITGMTCQNCAQHVQRALQGVAGVEAATVDLATARATVRMSANGTLPTAQLVEAVRAAGYDALPESAGSPTAPARSLRAPDTGWRTAVWLGVPVTLILAVAEWIFGLGMNRTYHWVAFALTLPVQVIVGGRFYQGAWRQLRVGRSNMDTLVSLGSTAAFGFSVWALFSRFPGHLYFMESAGILTLISIGHWLEARMTAQAGASLKALLRLAPQRARQRGADGVEREVPVAQLQRGDQIVLQPGDRVPVDAEVTEGGSTVEEAMLTGEPLPVEKDPGSQLYAGTVNQSGRLVAKVQATGEATALAHIIAAVERAQSSRADIQRLADRVSSIFVPVVVTIAVLTALWWGLAYDSARAVHASLAGWLWQGHVPETPVAAAFVMLAAVLIVACPCAMGLATPTALMAGVNAAARRGILIRDAQALEKSGRVNTVVFDKTGTLTAGRPEVVEVWPTDPPDPALPNRVAGLTRGSQHPLSRAIASWAGREGDAPPIPPGWRETRGSGVEGRWTDPTGRDGLLRLGSETWMKAKEVDLTPATAFVETWSARGASVLYLAADQRLWAVFALRDALKPGAKEIVERLRGTGHRVRLLTGDQLAAAQTIGAELGIPAGEISAGIRPEQKADVIRDLQRAGGRVAFVGDGLNDGPALAQADLGIAVTRATDVAKEAADILLLQSDLAAIPAALGLAQATLRVIRQNLFWAFFYNAAFVPLAALGFLSPLLSAVAMAASDVIVIGNALRLARK